jgi:hypothetical protein
VTAGTPSTKFRLSWAPVRSPLPAGSTTRCSARLRSPGASVLPEFAGSQVAFSLASRTMIRRVSVRFGGRPVRRGVGLAPRHKVRCQHRIVSGRKNSEAQRLLGRTRLAAASRALVRLEVWLLHLAIQDVKLAPSRTNAELTRSRGLAAHRRVARPPAFRQHTPPNLLWLLWHEATGSITSARSARSGWRARRPRD